METYRDIHGRLWTMTEIRDGAVDGYRLTFRVGLGGGAEEFHYFIPRDVAEWFAMNLPLTTITGTVGELTKAKAADGARGIGEE